eukprot:93584_1
MTSTKQRYLVQVLLSKQIEDNNDLINLGCLAICIPSNATFLHLIRNAQRKIDKKEYSKIYSLNYSELNGLNMYITSSRDIDIKIINKKWAEIVDFDDKLFDYVTDPYNEVIAFVFNNIEAAIHSKSLVPSSNLQKKIHLIDKDALKDMTLPNGITVWGHPRCTCKNMSECISIIRIKVLLSLYQISSCNMKHIFEIYNTIKNEYHYDVVRILNDYTHIIKYHDETGHDNDNLEQILIFLDLNCNMQSCDAIKRNRRNRMQIINNQGNHKQNVIVDIFDQLHCYILHSFDSGFKLLSSEKQKKNNNNDDEYGDYSWYFCHIRNLTKNKQKLYKQIIKVDSSLINKNKFVNQGINPEYIPDEDHETKSNRNNSATYSFSLRFYYWNKYKTDNNIDEYNTGYKYCELYIDNKYTSLKHEVLNNDIFCIGSKIWQFINYKCLQYLETIYIKESKANPYTIETLTGDDKYSSLMSLHHIICVMFYCDFPQLSYEFSSTFRYSSKIQTLDELKKYHSNYYWMAKYLRECVELFGSRNGEDDTWAYYHSISQLMLFTKAKARFNHPTSTSRQLQVAQYFASNNGDNGIVLELGCWCSFFQCSLISSFPNEDEHLYLGGPSPLMIWNITHCVSCKQYKMYMNAFSVFFDTIIDGSSSSPKYSDIRIIKSLIEGNETQKIPKYICNLFDLFKDNVEYV